MNNIYVLTETTNVYTNSSDVPHTFYRLLCFSLDFDELKELMILELDKDEKRMNSMSNKNIYEYSRMINIQTAYLKYIDNYGNIQTTIQYEIEVVPNYKFFESEMLNEFER